MSKTAISEEIAGSTGLMKKQVSSVFDELSVLIERHIKMGAVGQFSLPGLMKIEVRRKPATKARKGSLVYYLTCSVPLSHAYITSTSEDHCGTGTELAGVITKGTRNETA
jgi:nucleoid DNA-binding protein